jgi:CheR methyltransferase, all-alpha domain
MSKDVTLKDLLQELAEQRGLDFRGYKPTTLERRFRRRMFQLSIGTYSDYREYLQKNSKEVNELLNTILINVTEFFRDSASLGDTSQGPFAAHVEESGFGFNLSGVERGVREWRGSLLDCHFAERVFRAETSRIRHQNLRDGYR